MPSNLPSFGSSIPHPSLPNVSQNADHPNDELPKVGQTRCYWALLSSELRFLYFDPVLQSHLAEQEAFLVGRSLLDFVHPDEQASAKKDLGGVLENRTFHGSVTRVRFSRLSRVRRELGYQGPMAPWPDAEKIGVDSNYMAVDIVINWAAEGLVLCFIHAVVDINPADDNDEEHKTGWTNWCGTPSMTLQQAQLLYQRLLEHVPRPRDTGRIFQVLLNRPDRPLWMSWPPDEGPESAAQGRPSSRDFAKLAEEVQIGSSTGGSDAKTSCTRRYKALQPVHMGPEGTRQVESIFIPHGSIIFACHKVDLSPYSRSAPTNGTAISYANSGYASQSQPFYDPPPNTYDLPRLASGPPYNYLQQTPVSHNMVPHFPPHDQWSQGSGTPGHYGHEWPATSVTTSTSNMRSLYLSSQNNQHQWPSQPPSYNIDGSHSGQQRSMSPYTYSQTTGDANGSDGGSGSSEVPPPRSAQRRGAARDQYGSGGRSTGKPPVGINKCASCKVTQSPEWRKGPSGKKDLCNACGLRYARSRAKKEGVTSSRRRKDKVFTLKSDAQQQQMHGSHAAPSSSSARHGSFSDGSFLTPPSTTPNSEVYSSQTLNSPSPSPPSRSAMNFVHYSNQNQTHSPTEARASQLNYPTPSPMLDPASINHQSPPRGNAVTLPPRLAPVSFSASRMPHSSSNSPMSAGPPTHASSFERDSAGLSARPRDRIKRERDHGNSPIHLPSTPMSTTSEWSRKPASFTS